jgi:hypothetical protein
MASKFNVPDSGKTPTDWKEENWKQKTVNSLDKNSSMLNAANKWYKPVVDKLGDNTRELKKTGANGLMAEAGNGISQLMKAAPRVAAAFAAVTAGGYFLKKVLFDEFREGAALRNPRAEQTVEDSKTLFKMAIGKPMTGAQRGEANAWQKLTDLANSKEGQAFISGFTGSTFMEKPKNPNSKSAMFYNMARKIPFVASMQDEWNGQPRDQAPPMQQSQSFGNMAEWQNSMVQENLSLGGPNSTARKIWNEQAEEMQKDQNRPEIRPGAISRDDSIVKIVGATAAAIAAVEAMPQKVSDAIADLWKKAF